jgi:hypothetical protein
MRTAIRYTAIGSSLRAESYIKGGGRESKSKKVKERERQPELESSVHLDLS